MTVPEVTEKKQEKPCLICGDLTSGYITSEWIDFKDMGYKKEQFFIRNPEHPLADMDIVGYPICADCYKAEFEE